MITADTIIEKELRKELIDLAFMQYGKEYIHGKKGSNAFDCAGFAWFIYKELLNINIFYKGIGKSTTTKIMTSCYGELTLFTESLLQSNLNLIKEGDIVLFHTQSKEDNTPCVDNRYPGHCGIYLIDGYFIHCSNKKGGVVVDSIYENKKLGKKLVASKNIMSDNYALRKIINRN